MSINWSKYNTFLKYISLIAVIKSSVIDEVCKSQNVDTSNTVFHNTQNELYNILQKYVMIKTYIKTFTISSFFIKNVNFIYEIR